MATQQELSGKWNKLAGKVKEKFAQISDNDLTRANGNANQLVGIIQQKTGQSREQIEAFLQECGESCESIASKVSEFAASAGETLKDGYVSVADKTQRSYDASVKTVSQHPLESVGVAFGVGVLAGLLVGLSIGAQREREMTWRDRFMR